MPPSGKGHRRILIVGEAPGRQEDRDGRPFVGESGELLRKLLLKCGVDLRADCVITNALICRPPRNEIDDPKKVEMCNPGETPIWMGDLTFKRLEEIQVGQIVMGWQRVVPTRQLAHGNYGKPFIGKRSRKTLVPSTVLAVNKRVAPVVKVTLESGAVIRCTPDHMWLDGLYTWSNGKENFKSPVIGGHLAKVITPIGECPTNLLYDAGYLAGMIDGEGVVQKSCIMIAQSWDKNRANCQRLDEVATRLGFDFHWRRKAPSAPYFDVDIRNLTLSGIDNELKVLLWCQIAKKADRLEQFIRERSSLFAKDRIVSIEKDGEDLVYSMTTTTGNYVAWGYASKNCRPNLLETIRRHEPTVIIPLGKFAVKSVIGHFYKEDTKGIMRWAGFQIPNHRPNAWICPTVHPAFVLRERDKQGVYKDRGLRERWLFRHLKAAVDLCERKPWEEIPDYLSRVQVMTDTNAAAKILRRMAEGDRPVAIDYETTCLKPQSPHARIVCASVSDGRTTVCFPWLGQAVEDFKGLLRSPVPKMAHNQRFEYNWSVVQAGVTPRNFRWDSMVQAHTIDGRPGIVGLKFQAFVRLGQPDYDSHITSYLRSKKRGGNEPNLIKRIDFNSLALYCGADSLLTWLIAQEQQKTLGVRL